MVRLGQHVPIKDDQLLPDRVKRARTRARGLDLRVKITSLRVGSLYWRSLLSCSIRMTIYIAP
ncbi:MAG: hypothetical protein BWY75_00009 [bacterium ADurb.Bin425]|nr:MAG: hypothetical protein BWY75_00009 [bacterium ADurb.Bin425]